MVRNIVFGIACALMGFVLAGAAYVGVIVTFITIDTADSLHIVTNFILVSATVIIAMMCFLLSLLLFTNKIKFEKKEREEEENE